jgi:hypothetical protein
MSGHCLQISHMLPLRAFSSQLVKENPKLMVDLPHKDELAPVTNKTT